MSLDADIARRRAPIEPIDRYDYGTYSSVEPLFLHCAALPHGSAERLLVRERLIVIHLPLARHIARRFDRRGAESDDLLQVASLGLVKALDRFDPARGTEFLWFAVPTVTGEIRRHFRDQGWSVRVPRRLQEMSMAINAATVELSQRNSRFPTSGDLAGYLRVSRQDVVDGMAAGNSYVAASLDRPVGTDPDSVSVGEMIGVEEYGFAVVDNHQSLIPLMAQLPDRERRILGLRFVDDMTQTQIAEEIGVSQMHVSRLLTRTIADLRTGLLERT